MNKIPLTFCLFTTTKGHFDFKTRYIETLDSFNKALPLNEYADRLAHVKVSPGEENEAKQINDVLRNKYHFEVVMSDGVWKHGDQSHQTGYIDDCIKLYSLVKTPYVFHCEDDWKVKCYHRELIDYVHLAISYLENNPDLLQVRIARVSNEAARIDNLRFKHGLNRLSHACDADHFYHNDLSMNPSFFRTRDLRNALMLVLKTNLPKHIEHGLRESLCLMSRYPERVFSCFDTDMIRVGHIGTKIGEEDNLDKRLFV